MRFGTVLADAGSGSSAAFRHALDERGLGFAVGILCTQKVYAADVALVPPPGRARKLIPGQDPRIVEAVLDESPWRRVTWRQGTEGKLSARFSALRVRVADGPVFGNNQHLPGEEVWLVGEWRSSGERKYCLSNWPARITRQALVGAIKARWVCEQAHHQLEEGLGLDHFEGRSWTGLHRHALMTCLAFAYLQHRRLAGTTLAGRGKNEGSASGAVALAEPAGRAPSDYRTAVRQSSPACSVLLLPAPVQAAARPQNAQIVLEMP